MTRSFNYLALVFAFEMSSNQSSSKRGNAEPVHLTPEQIQAQLDENQLTIGAILENQNRGRFQAALQYQFKLQQSLLMLAALADEAEIRAPTN